MFIFLPLNIYIVILLFLNMFTTSLLETKYNQYNLQFAILLSQVLLIVRFYNHHITRDVILSIGEKTFQFKKNL